MNGIDAVALATGNDWRAVEAGAHAYAARGTHYTSLSRWTQDRGRRARGARSSCRIRVGIVGGPLQTNPSVGSNLRLAQVDSSRELAEVMGAVGLAQNFAALRALATEGIQRGHMTLHARSVATAAGATPEIFDTVVERLVASGEIKVWKARELIEEVEVQAGSDRRPRPPEPRWRPATARSSCSASTPWSTAAAPSRPRSRWPFGRGWSTTTTASGWWFPVGASSTGFARDPTKRKSFEEPAGLILEELGLIDRSMRIEVFSEIPRAMGLGGSAAVAVAIIRALDRHFELGLTDERGERARVPVRAGGARHAVGHRQHGRHLRQTTALPGRRSAADRDHRASRSRSAS